MKTISVLIKPASSSCNLRCRYCFYADVSENRTTRSSGVMKEETMKTLIKRIAEAVGENGTANFSFQGGEPTVAGLDYFKAFTAEVSSYPGLTANYSLQTNGTLIDEEWAQFFHDHNFLIGVSLDGYEANMNAFRYDAMKKGVYYKVLSGIDCLKKAKVDYNILTVVTKDLAKHPKGLMDFYLKHHFEYVQLIPCLPSLDLEDDDMALTPELYASFYKAFYDNWEKAYKKNRVVSVNLFENLAGMLRNVPPYQCGLIGKCFVQYVIESSGDVYPCDFYCLDEYCMGNLSDHSFEELSNSAQAKEFLSGSACRKAPCSTCRYQGYCNGGCRRQNICYLSDDYCAYQEVMEYIMPRLSRLIE